MICPEKSHSFILHNIYVGFYEKRYYFKHDISNLKTKNQKKNKKKRKQTKSKQTKHVY